MATTTPTGTYAIGTEVWFRGDPITITTEPYERHGAEWQDGVNEAGKVVTVQTPRSRDAQVAKDRAAHDEMQAGFRRLREKE